MYNEPMERYESIPVEVSPDGSVKLLRELKLTAPTRAILTIAVADDAVGLSKLSEQSLADWNNATEEQAWQHLQ